MPVLPKVTIEINETGTEFSVNVEGVVGKACDRIQKDLAGSGRVKREVVKPEFHHVAAAAQAHVRR